MTWSNDAEVVKASDISIVYKDMVTTPGINGFIITIDIINSSPNDIAYFDLRAFNPDNNINIYLMTRKSLEVPFNDGAIYKKNYLNEKHLLEPPEKNYGLLKANSFNKFDLFFGPRDNDAHDLKRVNISIKIAKKTFFNKDPFSTTNRKKFKFFGYSYDVSNWKELLEEPDNEILQK